MTDDIRSLILKLYTQTHKFFQPSLVPGLYILSIGSLALILIGTIMGFMGDATVFLAFYILAMLALLVRIFY